MTRKEELIDIKNKIDMYVKKCTKYILSDMEINDIHEFYKLLDVLEEECIKTKR